MTPLVSFRPRARLDLMEQFVYFSEQATDELAERYYQAVDTTCALLGERPRIGAACHFSVSELRSLRRLPVQGFENYLIFYLPRARGIEVVRVLHGARDIDNLLATEED